MSIRQVGVVVSSLIVFWTFSEVAAGDTITTVAGGGAGDGGAATNAALVNPQGLYVDAVGNLYIADAGNYRVRKVDVLGDVVTIAGGILPRRAGFDEGSLATRTFLPRPDDVAVDAAGNVYIISGGGLLKVEAETGTLMRVATPRALTTVAHAGGEDVYVGSARGVVYRVDSTSESLEVVVGSATHDGATEIIISGFGGDGGPATDALLDNVRGLFLTQSGFLYIADGDNHRIRMVDLETGIIQTVAGGGEAIEDGLLATEASLGFPRDVVVDTDGNLYIAISDDQVLKVDGATGRINTIAGNGSSGEVLGDGGPATESNLNSPNGLSLDVDGNLLVSEGRNLVRKIDLLTGIITTIAGGGVGDGLPSTDAFLRPQSVVADSAGNLYIADTEHNRVRRVDSQTGRISTVAGNGTDVPSGDGGPGTEAGLNGPKGLALDGDGNLYIGLQSSIIRRLDTRTGVIDAFVDLNRGGISDLCTDRDGNIYAGAIDFLFNPTWYKIAPSGDTTQVAGSGTLASATTGNGDGGAATDAFFGFPRDVAVDTAGNIYIAESNSSGNRVRKIDIVTGMISTVAGTDESTEPADGNLAVESSLGLVSGVALGPAGELYIASSRRILKVDANGILTSVAGSLETDFAGDGSPATETRLTPMDIEVSPDGTLYIVDDETTVRRIGAVPEQGEIELTSDKSTFAPDGSDVAVIQVEIKLNGILQFQDNSTEVYITIADGEGELSELAVTVESGIATVDLTTTVGGTVTVLAQADGILSDDITFTARPDTSAVGIASPQNVIRPGNGEGVGGFGHAMAVSGSYALIGAPEEDVGKGAVYVYELQQGVWTETSRILVPESAAGDHFGYSVAVSGSYAIIGAPFHTGGQGAAYVFTREGAVWRQQVLLRTSATNGFGSAVGIDGDYAIVGAPGASNGQGQANVYVRSGEEWTLQATLSASDQGARSLFGSALALSDTTAVVSAPEDDAKGSGSGAAYVFTRRGVSWGEQQKLTAQDGSAGDLFGQAVALSDGQLLVGAPQWNDGTGRVYAFGSDNGEWHQDYVMAASDGQAGDGFGSSVSILGRYAAIGAPDDDEYGYNSGSAYLLTFGPAGWAQHVKMVPGDGAAGDVFGSSVAVGNTLAIVGAPLLGGGGGEVHLFGLPELPDEPPVGPGDREAPFAGLPVLVDTDVDTSVANGSRTNEGAVEPTAPDSGEIVHVELFVEDAGGKQMTAFRFAFADSGGVFTGAFDLTGINGIAPATELLPTGGAIGNPSPLDVPDNDYVATVALRAKRDVEDELTIRLLAAGSLMADSTGVADTLDVVQAVIAFQRADEPEPHPPPTVLGDTLIVPGDFGTIQAAIDAADSGKVVMVSSGEYQEVLRLKPGVPLIGAGAASTTIRSWQDSAFAVSAGSGSRISGFTIAGSQIGVHITGESGLDPILPPPPAKQASLSSATTLIEDCIIRGHGRGLSTETAASGVNVTIRGNMIYENTDYAIYVGTFGTASIENNLVYDNPGAGVYLVSNRIARVINNTIDGNGRQGISFGPPFGLPVRPEIELQNNVITNNSRSGIQAQALGDSTRAFSYNDVWDNRPDYTWSKAGVGAISADPLFVDHRLGNGSPAIDAGNPSAGFNDQDGSRNDLGAYGGLNPLTLDVLDLGPAGPNPDSSSAIRITLESQSGPRSDGSIRDSLDPLLAGDALIIGLTAIQGSLGATGFELTLDFDASVLVFEAYLASDLFEDAEQTVQGNPGLLAVGGAQTGEIGVDSGSMGSVRFRVLSQTADTARVSIATASIEFGTESREMDVDANPPDEVRIPILPSVESASGLRTDYDENGRVDFADFLEFAAAFGSRSGSPGYAPQYDLDSDGQIDFSDFLAFVEDFGKREETLTGIWTGTYGTDLVVSPLLSVQMTQSGSTVTGEYVASSSAGNAEGVFSAVRSGNTLTFELEQNSEGCEGTFAGTGNYKDGILTFVFTGEDCLGSHSDGRATLRRLGQ